MIISKENDKNKSTLKVVTTSGKMGVYKFRLSEYNVVVHTESHILLKGKWLTVRFKIKKYVGPMYKVRFELWFLHIIPIQFYFGLLGNKQINELHECIS